MTEPIYDAKPENHWARKLAATIAGWMRRVGLTTITFDAAGLECRIVDKKQKEKQ